MSVLLALIITAVAVPLSKYGLQTLILADYYQREHGINPDKWHWADIVYYHTFGDYAFANEKKLGVIK
jgi:hypothetical protein